MHVPGLAGSLLSTLLVLDIVGAQSVVQVLGASPKQQIDGFGSSVAFLGQAIQGLPSTARTAILNLLFSTSSGAGFSILRTRISPYLLNSTSGQYDFNSDQEEVGTRYVVTQAKTLGVTRFLASSWTPPSQFKTNNNLIGGSINTSTTSFNGFAAYLSKYVTTYNQTYGINWYAISPQNEPELQTAYESCQWGSADFVNFLGTYLAPRFKQNNITTLTLAAESYQWFESTIAPTLSNATSRSAVQIVAAHPYGAGEYINGKNICGNDYWLYLADNITFT